MPKLCNRTPKYRLHKAWNLAVVTIEGRDFYLGPWKSKASQIEYDRLIGEWLANNRQLPSDGDTAIDVTELVASYWQFAKSYYVKDGKPTCLACIKVALRFLRQSYGDTQASNFGPWLSRPCKCEWSKPAKVGDISTAISTTSGDVSNGPSHRRWCGYPSTRP